MKKSYLRITIATLALIGIVSSCFTSKAAGIGETIPEHMAPGTIIEYNGDVVTKSVEKVTKALRKSGVGTSVFSKDIMYDFPIPENASEMERTQIELENQMAKELYNNYISGNVIREERPKASKGMRVVYDEITGDISNIYYRDANDPSGYSLHNINSVTSIKPGASIKAAPQTITWTWGTHNNILYYQADTDGFLGVGRATYYTGTYGNRSNRLKDRDCATQINHDYSKMGDKDITVRNLEKGTSYFFYQADVGSLPDAIIDIWGLGNLRMLAGSGTVTSVDNIRYYHKRFSDQKVPRN